MPFTKKQEHGLEPVKVKILSPTSCMLFEGTEIVDVEADAIVEVSHIEYFKLLHAGKCVVADGAGEQSALSTQHSDSAAGGNAHEQEQQQEQSQEQSTEGVEGSDAKGSGKKGAKK